MSTNPILRLRHKRRTTARLQKQTRQNRGLVSLGSLLVLILGLLLLGSGYAYAAVITNLPSLDQLPTMMDPNSGSLLQPTRLYDRSGDHVLMTLAPTDSQRIYLPYQGEGDHLPQTLVQATLAAMDPGFWSHSGYRLDGFMNPNSHNTIAQKLVSDLLIWDEPVSLRRALRERFLAAQLTVRFGREKILEWYLNSANYGHFAFGAEAAAQLYFGKPASQVTLAEAALLATVNQSPAQNPLDNPQAAIQRQKELLSAIQNGKLAQVDEISKARQAVLAFQAPPQPSPFAAAFIRLVLAQLDENTNQERIQRGGMQIITTLDFNLQVRSECTLETQLNRVNNPELVNETACPGSENLPPLPPGLTAPESAAATVLDPRSGQILALVGQPDLPVSGNWSSLAPHRPGTLLTPFIYLAGFTRGLSPASLVWDLPSGNVEQSTNQEDFLGPVRLRTALNNDSLSTAARVFDQMGAGLVQQTMSPFGLNIPAANLEALLADENHYSVTQMAHAYGVFAAQGALTGVKTPTGMSPGVLVSIKTIEGQLLVDWSVPVTEQVVSAQLAYLITDVLGDNLRTRSGLDYDRPVTFKNGRTLDGAESWAIGYTPYRVIAVWMAGKNHSPRISTGLWTAILRSSNIGVAPDGWTQPPGMLRIKVCDPSGLLPGGACPNIVDEIFIDGFQPIQQDTLYKSYFVNRETGLLATVFTPEQKIENRVYMLVPPEALGWAKAANLPVPPTQYDNLQPPAPNPDANITFPTMFAELQGKVIITGTASGADFSYYRLQYGKGLKPESWTLIGADSIKPVTAGILAEWDTSGLKGLYSLQLLVVRTDKSLQTATIQFTLNNP